MVPSSRIYAAVEHILSRSMGEPIRLGDTVPFGGDRARSSVVRCSIVSGPPVCPATVIAKFPRDDYAEGEERPSAEESRQRFLTEAAALEFLNTLELSPPVGPQLCGVDRESEIIVMEDLGAGASLADLLVGDDPAAAEAGLHAYARSLGRIHASTIGGETRYAAIHRDPAATRAWTGISDWETDDAPRFLDLYRLLDIHVTSSLRRELAEIGHAVDHAGPFHAFIVSDACPDNHVVGGDAVRFFDFEFSGFWHALLEGAYLRLPFPTCWCMGRLPTDLQCAAERTYRLALAEGCSAATDDDLFGRAMLAACAYWTVRTVGRQVERVLRADQPWGLASLRRRHVYRLESLARQADEIGALAGLSAAAEHMARALRARWQGDDLEMPLYPAFRGG